jgi:DNA-binding CsgD family transcriptional regulator/tetratricopeptide (TPR) repeat protein
VGDRAAAPVDAGREPDQSIAADHTELSRLSTGGRALVEVAAMFEETFSIDDLAAVLDEPVGKLLPAVHEVLAAEVVIPCGETLMFRHARTRADIHTTIPEALRGTLHRAIGAVLLDRGGCDAAAAAQLIQGARPGDRAMLAALDEVAGKLAARAPTAAADLALHVLDLTETGDELRFPRAATAVEALVAARRIGAAAQLARDTLSPGHAPAGPAARLRLTLCAVQLAGGDLEPAVAEATALLAEGHLPEQQQDGAELVRLVGLLAGGDLQAAELAAHVVLAGGERPGSDATLGAGLSTLAWVAWCRGHLTTALDLIRAAVQRSARGGPYGQHPELWLGAMLTALGELDEATEVLDPAGDNLGRPADALWEPVAPLLRARLHLADGRLDEAVAQSRLVLALADELGIRLVVPIALATLAQVSVLRGDLDRAARYLDRTEPGPTLIPTDAATLTWVRAQLAAARDGAPAALRVLSGWCSSLPTEPIPVLQEPAAVELTRVAVAVGDDGLARSIVTRTEQLAASNPGLPSLQAVANHARGLLDRNVARLSQAAADYRRPWSAASAHEDAGALLAEDGDRTGGRSEFEHALDDYGRAGAERDAARLRSRLRELGVRPYHWARAERPASGWGSLTDAERRVANAVAEGLTNRQSADQLFLSRHTVDFHLRQIFLKLGIRSRVELTRLVLQHAD